MAKYLDIETVAGPVRVQVQEEYIEQRTVRNADNEDVSIDVKMIRVEVVSGVSDEIGKVFTMQETAAAPFEFIEE